MDKYYKIDAIPKTNIDACFVLHKYPQAMAHNRHAIQYKTVIAQYNRNVTPLSFSTCCRLARKYIGTTYIKYAIIAIGMSNNSCKYMLYRYCSFIIPLQLKTLSCCITFCLNQVSLLNGHDELKACLAI